MKKIILTLIVLLFSALVVAVPPSLDNHQFYGNVYWDVNDSVDNPVNVNAEVAGFIYASKIKDIKCTHVCSGTYGKDTDNILRLSADAGNVITFSLDNAELTTKIYESNTITEFDIKTNKVPILKKECKENWNWSNWTECNNSKQTRFGIDLNKCDPTKLNTTAEKSCKLDNETVDDTSTADPCAYKWQCTDWGTCINSEQTRICTRSDDCDVQLLQGKVPSVVKTEMPDETLFCIEDTADLGTDDDDTSSTPTPPSSSSSSSTSDDETCFDEEQNQDEEDVDCGGSYCDPCSSNTFLIILVVSLFLVLLGGGAYYYFIVMKGGSLSDLTGGSSKPSPGPSSRPSLPNIGGSSLGGGLPSKVEQQLKSTYQKGMAKGLSKVQITQKLQDRGWDPKMLTKFLENN